MNKKILYYTALLVLLLAFAGCSGVNVNDGDNEVVNFIVFTG